MVVTFKVDSCEFCEMEHLISQLSTRPYGIFLHIISFGHTDVHLQYLY